VPGQRCTTEKAQERTEFVQGLLAENLPTGEIKRLFRAKYGDHSHTTILRYLSRAREENLKVVQTPRTQAVANSYNFYLSVIGNRYNKTKDRIDACTRIDKLLGLELKLPPLEVLSAHLGITTQQLIEFIGGFAGQSLPHRTLPAPEAQGPDEIPG
jgi:hypothetical protein